MAVKYTIPYRSIDDTPWRVDILLDSWTDDPITVRGHGNRCCTIEYDGGVDDPFDNPVVSSKASIELINQGEIDIDELQEAAERDFVVEVYRDNALKWKGYLVTDNIQQPYQSTPYVVQLSAIDGLNMLEGITFSINNLPAPPGGAIRCPLNWLRLVLFREQNLGLMLPIRWYIGLENVATEDDPLAGLMTWSPYGEGIQAGEYIDGTGQVIPIYQNCRYILEGLVKAFGARIFQADGAWHVMRTNDIIGGSFTYNECDATLGVPTITQHTVDINRLVVGSSEPGGDYSFIREDALLTVKPPLSKVDVEYDSDRRENILPNGGLDLWSLGFPLYWGFTDNPESAAFFEAYDSLRPDNYGDSVLLTYPVTGAPEPDNRAIFSFNGGLPVDAHLLFKRFTWGFTFMPLNGFPYHPYNPSDPDDPNANVINWDANPLRVRVYYEAIDKDGVIRTMYLNEFGYWQSQPAEGYMVQTGYNRSTGGGLVTHTITYAGYPKTGDVVRIHIDNTGIIPDLLFEYIVEQTDEGDLEAVLQAASAGIASATVSMSGPYSGQIQFTISDSFTHTVNPSVTSGANTLLPGNWIPISVNQMKIGDVASVVFQGKGGNSEILFPDPGSLDWDTVDQSLETGVLYIEFAVLEGQKYVLDEIWVRVGDNNDVYRASVASRGNSQSITLGISSSFSGFMVSNLMRSYHQSNEDFIWSDGTTESSLTEHYARAVMRWRYKPSKIFNGTINTRTKDWSFFEIYTFSGMDGRKFLPLNAKYNTELCEVNLVAMEGRDDGVITDVQHYASNNMPLSNYGG